MFLSVSRRHVGVSIQSSVNLAKTFLLISRISKITEGKLYLQNGFDFSGAPNDGFLPNALKILIFRLSRELLDLSKHILIGAIKVVSVRSSQGSLGLFEITRASVLFFQTFCMQFKVLLRKWEFPYQIQHCFECIFKLFLKTVFNLFCEIGLKQGEKCIFNVFFDCF